MTKTELDLKHQLYRPEGSKENMRSGDLSTDEDQNELLGDIEFEDTSSITVPENLIDQVIGQDEAVEVIRKAAHQRRHVMLIGSPGTGNRCWAKP